MKFISIKISEGVFSRSFDFSEKINLVHSEKNTRGKTTLLRFLLYSIGYPIPNTRNIKFESCDVESVIDCSAGIVTLHRYSQFAIDAEIQGETTTFILPAEQNDLQSILFGTKNKNILNNILGAFYLDQEKGWTLLNRGKVIGSIGFNIEELICGLSDRDCSLLLEEKIRIENEKRKYKSLLSISQFRNDILEEQGDLIGESFEIKERSKIDALIMEQEEIRSELNRINASIRDNRNFVNFISSMRIYVRSKNGEEVLVTKENIVDYNDFLDTLEARKKLLTQKLSMICRQIDNKKQTQKSEEEQLSFYTAPSMLEITGQEIAKLPLDAVVIKRMIDNLDRKLQEVNKKITNNTKFNNLIVDELFTTVNKYAEELDLTKEKQFNDIYLFTHNLKELSGAVMHKTVFAFHLGYIVAIENALGIKLPVILDSPSGKEVDKSNITRMLNILKRDFSDHQIIIASIFNYEFDHIRKIEIINRLIE